MKKKSVPEFPTGVPPPPPPYQGAENQFILILASLQPFIFNFG